MCFRTRLIRLFSIVLLFSVVSSLPAWAQRDRRVKTSVTSSAANHLPVARKALEKGNYNNAIKYAEKVLKANPGNDEALYIKQEAERLLAEEKKFKELQAQLEGTENRINVARTNFNNEAKKYNTTIRTFPRNMFAGMLGFTQRAYFEAEAGANQAPKVEF